ncbi:MAG: hypothetical protein JW888_06290 [Pirellulales bacterium]|nr:hypothetical protein [Pirellulales bacterium]
MVTSIKALFAGLRVLVHRGLAICRPAGRRRSFCLPEAQRRFHGEREHLEAKFIDLAQVAHHRVAPRWLDCDFEDKVTYARNRRTGRLSALVTITVIVAGRRSILDNPKPTNHISGHVLPEELTALPFGSLRWATAEFSFDGDHWDTEGRVVFNLSPVEMVLFYRHDLELLGREPDPKSSTA